jgi:hypothetical protein
MSFLELQNLIQRRKADVVKRHETLQRNMYLQTARRQKFFNEVHRSTEEREGLMAPDPEQHQPFIAQQRGVLKAAGVQEAASAAAAAEREAAERAAANRAYAIRIHAEARAVVAARPRVSKREELVAARDAAAVRVAAAAPAAAPAAEAPVPAAKARAKAAAADVRRDRATDLRREARRQESSRLNAAHLARQYPDQYNLDGPIPGAPPIRPP